MTRYNDYIYGNEDRIFINTNLGCSSQCSYCYLPDLNIDIGTKKKNSISINGLINNLLKHKSFIAGRDGTILSLGCYSECWDEFNQNDTLYLLEKLIPFENPIQLSTKRQIKLDTIKPILSKLAWQKQLNIYISNSTISHWKKYEQKTTKPEYRFKSFDITLLEQVPMYLYIKPVLPRVTIKDVEKYILIAKEYKIDIILGKMFNKEENNNLAPIGNNRLFYNVPTNQENDEYQFIYDSLIKHTNVYTESIEPINLTREKNNGII